jgi:hypothetical protein
VSSKVQGDERKQTADEVSKTIRRRQNWGPFTLPGKVQRKPVYCLGGVRHAGGVNLNQAFVWNVGTCRPDVKGETQVGSTHEGKSTDAGHGGGPTRISVEVPVTGMERRGWVIWPYFLANQ